MIKKHYSYIHIPSFLSLCFLIAILALTPLLAPSATLPSPAIIPQLPETYKKVQLYRVYWSGFHIGDLVAQLSQNQNQYTIRTYLLSRGIAYKFSKYQAVSMSTTRFEKGKFIPESFTSESRLHNSTRKTMITYNSDGSIRSEQVIPPDDKNKRPPVAPALKKATVDPHTPILIAFLRLEDFFHHRFKSTSFTIPLYEARKRSNLMFNIYGLVKEPLNNNMQQMIKITLQRRLLAGLTRDERVGEREEEPLISIFLKADGTFFPLKAIAKAPIGSAIAIYDHSCNLLSECLENSNSLPSQAK